MFTNKEYLFRRVAWLDQVSRGIESETNQALVIDRLNQINNGNERPIKLKGVFFASYPATFRVRAEGDDSETDVDVWVKETRIGYDTSIPAPPVNECKIMGTIIRDMFFMQRSPHFVYPVGQIVTNDRSEADGEEEHMVTYNIMEYLPKSAFMRFRDWLKTVDMNAPGSRFEVFTAVFQILYNLLVMSNLRFTHGDLHLDNILISPSTPFKASYVVSETAYYEVPSPVFTVMIDFAVSGVRTDQYKSITDHQEFDPLADLTMFISQLFRIADTRPELYAFLFPSDHALREELSKIDPTMTVLEVLERYADQVLTRKVPPAPETDHTYVAYR